MQGTVKFFNDRKGWGFIEPDDGEEDVFVHYTHIDGDGYRTLKDGDRVEFERVTGQTGKFQAVEVKRLPK